MQSEKNASFTQSQEKIKNFEKEISELKTTSKKSEKEREQLQRQISQLK